MENLIPKIYFHPLLSPRFEEFGIQIPLMDDRGKKCFLHLKKFDQSLEYLDLERLTEVGREDLCLAHEEDFVDRILDPNTCVEELMKCYELVDDLGNYVRYNPYRHSSLQSMIPHILRQVSATYLAALDSLSNSFSFFLGGGMHHAMSFGGRGFCPVNDIVIALLKLKNENRIKNAWVVDTDAHKGDGTAELTYNCEEISTLSIHMEKGWPLDGESHDKDGNLRPWFIPSTIDIGIPEGGEDDYLRKLEDGLFWLEKEKKLPDMVMVVAGSDPFEKDVLPSSSKIKLGSGKMLARDLLVYRFFKDRGVPQCWLMAGGYGPDSYLIYTQFLERVFDF